MLAIAEGFEEGALDDCEKYEAALNAGWIVYRVPSPWIYKGNRRIWRARMLFTIRRFVGLLTVPPCSFLGPA